VIEYLTILPKHGGKTIQGKMEILMSPGYINFGIISCKGDNVADLLRHRIKIGVSSRGVGSLKRLGMVTK
jgi:hypothetical protein